MLHKAIAFFLERKPVTLLLLFVVIVWGIGTAPFGWKIEGLPTDPVAVDAIPDIGENQQIVFTKWAGRSPQDIEDQITYPLTTSLLGIPGVKTIRSSSAFGFSSIYVIFKDDVEFYWSRSRILEKLNSLPSGTLPGGVAPQLGPDATALGQVYWYTLEGHDKDGNVVGGWSLQELRSIQDFNVKYALSGVDGVSEAASIGGYVKEYQIDIDPQRMKDFDVTLDMIVKAIKQSNKEVGAKTLEINKAEYFVRGLGYVKSVSDIEDAVLRVKNATPVKISDVAKVHLGPATRRGLLDKGGAEAVGGVVVARYGANPMEVINNIKAKIDLIKTGLPEKTLKDGTVSKVTIVPFYDRSVLINQTLFTLMEALSFEILITILVIIVMLRNLSISLVISGLLPLAILMVFIAMRFFGVDANIVALSGIAIAIGTMVDVGVIVTENVMKHFEAPENKDKTILEIVYNGTKEVGGAVITAVMTTVVSFLPIFSFQAAEGKLFHPLAATKSFALISALIVSLFILPLFTRMLLTYKTSKGKKRKRIVYLQTDFILNILLAIGAFYVMFTGEIVIGFALLLISIFGGLSILKPDLSWKSTAFDGSVLLLVVFVLSRYWMPLGVDHSLFTNVIFVALIISVVLGIFKLFAKFYTRILAWALHNKVKFLMIPAFIVFFGMFTWLGFDTVFASVKHGFNAVGWKVDKTAFWKAADDEFPGIGQEFMPALDEGEFLLMPTSMPSSGFTENKEVVSMLDKAVAAIPEIESVVGKMGRAETALDPAPISMYENTIRYKSEFAENANGSSRLKFAVDEDGNYKLKNGGTVPPIGESLERVEIKNLIPDDDGEYFRQWRDHIKSPDDIWNEITAATKIPGVTGSPKLQPIQTRIVMLQSGMRSPMGVKIYGPTLETIEAFGLEIEKILKTQPQIKKSTVFAERVIGKPYLEIEVDRNKISKYGLNVADVLKYVEIAIGGVPQSFTVEGRERYPIRARYMRELRDSPEAIEELLIDIPGGNQIPLKQVAKVNFERGPQVIKSEDTFLVSYVTFDKISTAAEVDVVLKAQKAIKSAIDRGELKVPPSVTYKFAGNYENQLRANKRLSIIVPLTLLAIFMILYFQFKKVNVSLMIFTGIAVAFSGGFIMIWLYNQEWFMNFHLLGTSIRDVFQIAPVNVSTAVWVGFIALFGIATDDGVLMAEYMEQTFADNIPKSVKNIRETVIEAATKRLRPALMTSATTILALLPVLTSHGRGSDIMIPMAIPSFGGMLVALITLFVVPLLYSWYRENELRDNLLKLESDIDENKDLSNDKTEEDEK